MNKEKYLEYLNGNFAKLSFSFVGFAIIDFSTQKWDAFVCHQSGHELGIDAVYFDLASLTKPLTLASSYLLHPEIFNEEMQLLLDHQSGLPSWGLLARDSWKSQLLSYPIKKSKVDYSDFGALRLQLELEKKWGKSLKNIGSEFWDKDLCFWQDLPSNIQIAPTGHRGSKRIVGEVHDPNGFIINEFCSHAGLFSTLGGLARTLLNLENKTHFVQKMETLLKTPHERFVKGWDTVENPENTLAGKDCSPETFGHLGFTGTSIWIDARAKRGHLLLTNATESYWNDRAGLNDLRRQFGQWAWE